MGAYPALYVNPPQDPTQSLERAVSLRNLLQNAPLELQQRQQAVQLGQGQVQLQQQQIKDQQAVTAAWKSYDPSKQKPEDLIKGVLDNGGSGAAANQLQQMMLARQQQLMTLDKDSFDLQQKRSDRMIGRFDAAKGVSDDQLADHVSSAIQESVQAGDLKPQEAQQASQVFGQLQGNPKGMRDALDSFEKSHMLGSQIASRAKEAADTAKAQAEANAKQQEAGFYQRNPSVGAPGVPTETAQMASTLQQNPGMTAAQYPAYKAAAVSKAEAPVRIAVAQAEGQARANIEAATARGSNAALATVPPHLVAPATAAATKAGEDYASAVQTTSNMRDFINAAKAGNKEAYAILPEQGTLQVTTAQGVHRINSTEISQYAGAGSLWDNIMGKLGKLKSGASIPPDVLNDIDKLQGMIGQNAQKKYGNALKTVNQNYGAKFEPVQMDNAGGGHSFTFNGQRYENVPDSLYNKYKSQKGFSE